METAAKVLMLQILKMSVEVKALICIYTCGFNSYFQFILPKMSRNKHRLKYYRIGISDLIQYCGFWTLKSL